MNMKQGAAPPGHSLEGEAAPPSPRAHAQHPPAARPRRPQSPLPTLSLAAESAQRGSGDAPASVVVVWGGRPCLPAQREVEGKAVAAAAPPGGLARHGAAAAAAAALAPPPQTQTLPHPRSLRLTTTCHFSCDGNGSLGRATHTGRASSRLLPYTDDTDADSLGWAPERTQVHTRPGSAVCRLRCGARLAPERAQCGTPARAAPPPPRHDALRTLPRPDTCPPLSLRTQGAPTGRPPNLRRVPALILRENKGQRRTGNSARTCVAR